MRTVDPNVWYMKAKVPNKRKLFGSQSMTQFENRMRSSFVDAMKDFWVHCSIEGVKYIREKNMHRNVRRCYVVFIVLVSLCGALALQRSWADLDSAPPFIVSLLSVQHPVHRVDFPAVAICGQTVLSREAISKYARHIYSLDANGTYSLEDIHRNLLAYGALVTWSSPPVDVAFTEYLARVARETNVTKIIMKLTPQCASFLKRCSWRAVRLPCGRLFALRATPHGYCCVFNSRYQDEDLHNPVKKLHFVGQDFGLSLVVKEDERDTAFVRGPGDGVEVLLFDGNDYPLLEGGSSRLYLTQRNSSLFLTLSARAQQPSPALAYYTEERRGCRMRLSGGASAARRSQAWCLADCRRRAARTLCGCVPHLLLPHRVDPVCSPDHLACLNKYKEKFLNFYPGDSADSSLQEESSDSLSCEECAPDCYRLQYSAAACHAPYHHVDKLLLKSIVNRLNLANTTVIRIYYTTEDQNLYIVESNRYWFEIAVFLGSQTLCCVAVTLISVSEVVYFAVIRWSYHYSRRLRADDRQTKQLAPSID